MTDIFTLPLFDKKLKHYAKKNPFMKKDFSHLLNILENSPIPQEAISLKEDTFKIRVKNSSSNRGKSGGYRIYYFYKTAKNSIVLFYMHSKSDEANINEFKLNALIKECQIFFEDSIL